MGTMRTCPCPCSCPCPCPCPMPMPMPLSHTQHAHRPRAACSWRRPRPCPQVRKKMKKELDALDKVANADTIKKVLVKSSQLHYHPDKNIEKLYGLEWHVLCMEISKHLNGKYNTLKAE